MNLRKACRGVGIALALGCGFVATGRAQEDTARAATEKQIEAAQTAFDTAIGAVVKAASDEAKTALAKASEALTAANDAAAALDAAEPGGTTITAAADELANASFKVDNLWVAIAGMLVFMMHLGFAMVESGLCRSKNCANILFKNTLTPAIGFLTYALIGFGLMYPGDSWILGKILGFCGAGMNPSLKDITAHYGSAYTYWTDFFFQGMFAATGATIVSGAVAERIKVNAYMLFTFVFVSFVYPVVGSWGWGGGWLADLGFHDFAGSTFVHSVGGWGALAGVALLGARYGKYAPDGTVRPIMGHSMPMATIGVFLLWFGWFGFNGGSVLSAAPAQVSYVLVSTMIAASAGLVGAMLTSSFISKKPDLSITLNGCLAGLVGITAGADVMTIGSAVAIGFLAGVIVVLSVIFWDKLKLDDPVGALSVHLVCGIFGTLAVGIFPTIEGASFAFLPQLYGVLAAAALTFPAAIAIFLAVRTVIGLRVSREEELRGLDICEHNNEAYPDFQGFLVK
jgi:Amt family ammonium transporter